MKNLYAAVCEDEPKILKYLAKILHSSFLTKEIDFSIDTFQSGQELLSTILSSHKHYTVFFLDIEMPELNGIELCRKIRMLASDALVIFISGREEMVFQTFEVQPFRFVRKDHFLEELPKLIQDICQELDTRKDSFLTIQEQGGGHKIFSININHILYIEVIGKFCYIVSSEEKLTIRYQLSQLESMLIPYGFLRPHRGYLVNYKYIYSIATHSIILDNKEEIPLSKKRANMIKKQFIELSQKEL